MIDYFLKNTRKLKIVWFIIFVFTAIEFYLIFFTTLEFTIALSLLILESFILLFMIMTTFNQGMQLLLQRTPNLLDTQNYINFIEQEESFKKSVNMQVNLSTAYFYNGQIDQAILILKNAMLLTKRKESQAFLYYSLTSLYFYNDQYPLGIEALNKAEQLLAKRFILFKTDLNHLSLNLQKHYQYYQGEISNQERILDLKERLLKEDREICSRMILRYYIADAYINMQQYDQAYKQLAMMKRLTPNLIVTHRLAQRLEMDYGKD